MASSDNSIKRLSGSYKPDDAESKIGTVESTVIPLEPAQAQHGDPEGFWGKTRQWIRTMGVEEVGIERITDAQRTDRPAFDLFTFFTAVNCNVTTLATGFLGTATFGLGWWDSFLCIIFFNLIGVIAPAIYASFGPKLGLRSMVIPRYVFGWWPAKVLAILNIVNQIGWGIVSAITSGEILYDVADGKMPLAISILVVCIVGLLFGLLGYRALHIFDRYSWIVVAISFIIIAGFGGRHFVNVPMGVGSSERANVFAFATVIIGYEVAWMPVVADYGVYMHSDMSTTATAGYTLLGLLVPQILVELLGAAIGSLTMSSDAEFAAAYDRAGMGGLIGAIFNSYSAHVYGFGKFIEVLVAFSIVAILAVNVYSLGLNVQVISRKMLAVPRFVWTLVGSAALLSCSIAGRNVLAEIMTNFLSICTYWLVPFCNIMMLEHFIWRRDWDYDVTAWENPSQLPYGIAATVAFLVGTVLSLLCMNQVWWVGPIAKAIGPSGFGTDISWILALCTCTGIFVPLRMWERKRWGR